MFQHLRYRRVTLSILMLFMGVMSSSCTSFGPKEVISSHTAYNESVQLTVTREVLSNIVRSRYLDPMQFLAVSAINTQFSVNVGGTAGVAGIGQTGASGDVGASIGYSNSPTITFIPQSDYAFYASLNSSFEVSEAIAFGQAYRFAQSHPDWLALSLSFSFASINGADDFVGGKFNKRYSQRIDALARLLQLGSSYQQVPEWDYDTVAIAKDKVTGEDMVDAFGAGLYFVEENAGKNLRLARYRLVIALSLPAPGDPQVVAALKDLGVRPGRTRYILRPPMHAIPGAIDPYAIWVTPRSMADVLNLATHFVDVPAEHAGIVPPLEITVSQSSVMSAVRIRSAKDEPPFPYRVQHRGHWFYVDDTDINSKVFLEAMVTAYSSRVGSKQVGDDTPQVVIPVGGG